MSVLLLHGFETRATQTADLMSSLHQLQKKGGPAAAAESPPGSPGSNYSSAWETSESDVDGALDLEELQEARPSPTTIFEDNQAKMTEKGAKGEHT